MTLLERVITSRQDTLVVAPPAVQHRLLRELSAAGVIAPLTFLTPKAFVDKVFHETKPHAVHEASVFFDVKPAIARESLRVLPTLLCEPPYESAALARLQTLKTHLEEKGSLVAYPHLETFFMGKRITIDGTVSEDLVDRATERVRAIAPVEHLEDEPLATTPIEYTMHGDIESEIAHVARAIRRRLEEGVDLEDIHVVCLEPGYLPTLRAVFSMYDIPLRDTRATPLMRFATIGRWLKRLRDLSDEPLPSALAKLFADAASPGDETTMKLKVKFVETVMSFFPAGEPFKRVEPAILDALERVALRPSGARGAMLHHGILRLGVEGEGFFIGVAEGTFPAVKGEDDILSAQEKRLIGRDDAKAANRRAKRNLLYRLCRLERVSLSRSEKGPSGTMHDARFLEEVSRNRAINTRLRPTVEYGCYGAAYDAYAMKKRYDAFRDYGEEDPTLAALYYTHAHRMKTYDNRFKGVSQRTLESLLPRPLPLSFTRLNTYHRCRFRYAMEHLLRIDPIEASLRLDIGVFLHAMLERHIEKDAVSETLLMQEFETFQRDEGKNPTPRERFLFQRVIETFVEVFAHIKAQHARSDYTLFKKESRHAVAFERPTPATFSGVVDKIMKRDAEDGKMNLLLIDYKSGATKMDLSRIYYGIDAQLVYYAWLVGETFEHGSPRICGMYEQAVLPSPLKTTRKPYEETMRDVLRLDGFTLANADEARRIDTDINGASYIKGLRLLKSGGFHASSKMLSESDLDSLKNHLRKKIDDALEALCVGRFDIDPKKDVSGNEVSCEYCAFADVCFKKYEDFTTMRPFSNGRAVREAIEQGGER